MNTRIHWIGALLCLAGGVADGQPPRLGGCQTTERDYGLPALYDSLAAKAIAEMMAPGRGPKTGPACRRLQVDTPVYAQVGTVDSLDNEVWVAVVEQVTARLSGAGCHLAERTRHRHTTGTCFPPYHVDLRACADSAAAERFLDSLAGGAWDGFTPTKDRGCRRLFVVAGRSMQLMTTGVDLK